MDAVFKAIDDPSRRLLLDRLFVEDGQTLTELCAHLPQMTRHGVMNHLRVLEEADLVVTKREGRTKLHYLNPVPIRLIHDRWISRFAERPVGTLAALTTRFEQGDRTMDDPAHVYATYIRATADEVWDAITDPDMTEQYFYGTRVDSSWEVGAPMTYAYPDGRLASDGVILAIDRPKRIEFTFHALWDEELAAEGPTREVWSLDEVNGMVRLTVELYDIDVDSRSFQDFTGGIPYILSGMKSLLETSRALPSPS